MSFLGGRSTGMRARFRSACLLLMDLAVMFAAWVLAVLTASALGKADLGQWFPLVTREGSTFSLMTLLVVFALAASGQYGRRAAFWEEVRLVWRYAALVSLINFALNFFVQVSYTRTLLLLAWVNVLVMLPVGRLVVREWLVAINCWKRATLLVGEGQILVDAWEAMSGERHMGMKVVGVMTLSGTFAVPSELGSVPAFAIGEGIDKVAQDLGCEVLVLALDAENQLRAGTIVSNLRHRNYELFVAPALRGLPVQGLHAQYFFSNDVLFLRLQHRLFQPTSRFLKRFVDITVSIAALLLLSPLLLWVCLAVWREDGRPVIYAQRRVGLAGEDFHFFKFRSMVRDADALLQAWPQTNPALFAEYQANNFKLANDPRILRTGAWIRRRSIDELPQLWNVLRGDMSLVGPRPLLRRELPEYDPDALNMYLQVRPGITGLWQVSGRSETTFLQRAGLDSWYVRNWSLWVDLVILLKTVRVVLSGKGAM